jgi:hypothetical protein
LYTYSNQGYAFSSWTENLGKNSSKAITVSPTPDYLFYFLNILHLAGNDKSSTLDVTHNGNFSANFEKVAPPLPPEYWTPLYGVIVTTIVGWSIPSIIGWIKTKKQGRILRKYHKIIDSLHHDDKSGQNDTSSLDKLKTR